MNKTSWHTLSTKEALTKLKATANGLTSFEARRRLSRYGLNELIKKKDFSGIKIFLSQFKSVLVLILIIAVGVSAIVGNLIDAFVIGVIILINAILGFTQEYRAEKSMEALEKLSAPKAQVLRDNREVEINASKLVPGDIIILSEGDRIPADARLIGAINLAVDESTLTGESKSVSKQVDVITKEKIPLGEKKNCVFMNTITTRGRGIAVVTDTGMNSEIGNIAKLIQTIQRKPTPLQNKLTEVAKSLGLAVIIIAGLIFGLGLFRGGKIIDIFLTSVSLAVAAVPEGLPAVVTITLALGLKQMAKAKAYIRKLSAVETLGSASVICSDKTGTLTKNEMTVQKLYTNHKTISVSGEGYNPGGKFFLGKKEVYPIKSKNIELLLRAATLCTTSNLYRNKKGWYITGDPTEGALVVSAMKAGLDKAKLLKKLKHIGELPFDSKRKRMSIIFENSDKQNIAYVKGAPEILLERCTHIFLDGGIRRLTLADKKKVLQANRKMANSALRILGVAYKRISKQIAKQQFTVSKVEENLIFIGLQGMIDAPRPEVRSAITKSKNAGIIPVMITGDHSATARAIAVHLGLIKSFDEVTTGEELDKLSGKKLKELVNKVRVFARVSPEHKVRIVNAFKSKGHIVAMTGDGVNDAPALKQADIGIAMGKIGTDVAKESADMILGDDNFTTIITAVEKGRGVYANIQKFIRYLLSSNTGEVMTIFLAELIGLPLPLIAVQILWMNLLTDGLPALALGVDPPEKDIMSHKPRDPKSKTIGKGIWIFSIVVGISMMLGTLFIFWENLSEGLNHARTMAFTTIIMFQLFNVFNSRTNKSLLKETSDIFNNYYLLLAIAFSILLQMAVVYIPFLQALFGTVPLGIIDWVWVLLISSSIIAIVELKKLITPHSFIAEQV